MLSEWEIACADNFGNTMGLQFKLSAVETELGLLAGSSMPNPVRTILV
jgi:hypothetical protein